MCVYIYVHIYIYIYTPIYVHSDIPLREMRNAHVTSSHTDFMLHVVQDSCACICGAGNKWTGK